MKRDFATLRALLDHESDAVIDVRSPSEFAHDHIPGAINLPVLNDAERAEVGTIYVQQSAFLARKIGAAKVFRNAARHIDEHLQGHDGAWRPLVYCWRGGQRSGSFGWMLGQIGWRAEVLDGGYRSYRRLVNAMLYKEPVAHEFIALDGYTGTAKTALLHLLAQRGVQVVDLEGLAEHRGSLLGAGAGPQPSQKLFETRIAASLSALDPARPVLIEAESSKIGDRIIPPSLWAALKSAPRIEISAPIAARTDYLVEAYDDILSDGPRLGRTLGHLRTHRGHRTVDGWLERIAAGDRHGLTRALMQEHYDPAYLTSRKSLDNPVLARIAAERLDAPGLHEVADRIEAAMQRGVQI